MNEIMIDVAGDDTQQQESIQITYAFFNESMYNVIQDCIMCSSLSLAFSFLHNITYIHLQQHP